MAELATLARPYARAAFDYANDANALQEWSDALQELGVIAAQDKVRALCLSPELTAEQQANAVLFVAGDSANKKVQNLVRLLAENNRLTLLPSVASMFAQLKANKEKTVDVEITTAYALDESSEQSLAETLAKKLDRQVNVKSTVDENLLGGVLIRAGDLVIDGSVRGKLAKLAEALNS